jgi:site-specific DNA recombinase
MARTTQQKAVIYCRVSNVKQTVRGDGLGSQETRCREYAKYRGHDVIKVFKDDSSGSLIDRPGMQEMLAFIRKNRTHGLVVIIDDISRLARGLEAHLRLRADISRAGGTLESPSIEFGEDSDSRLVENLLASVSQHQRQKNGEQTANRMRSRALNGYWVFQAPWGYTYARAHGGGKIMVRSEPLASIIQEALEGFASGRFGSQAEVMRFLESHPKVPRLAKGRVSNWQVTLLLTQPLYAGYLEVPRWNVSLRKGQHEGLISLETFNKIQDRLKGKARSPARVDINADFPLRGHLGCACCGHPMTANWSKGARQSYPYYLCRQPGCENKGKSIARDKVEGEFAALLRRLSPSGELVELARAIFKDLWDKQAKAAASLSASLRKEARDLDRQIKLTVDRLVETDSPAVVAAYERRVAELEKSKLEYEEKAVTCVAPKRDHDETFRTALAFLASPWNLWESNRLEDKRAVLKLTFGGLLKYDRESGFRTPDLSLPFKMLGEIFSQNFEMARPKRFELLTPRFVVWCSIQLSYGRVAGPKGGAEAGSYAPASAEARKNGKGVCGASHGIVAGPHRWPEGAYSPATSITAAYRRHSPYR